MIPIVVKVELRLVFELALLEEDAAKPVKLEIILLFWVRPKKTLGNLRDFGW